MEESKDTKIGLTCPFCGAPYRGVVPSDAAQVKCEYCGEVFSVSPYLKDTIPRCPNHSETFATGLCNDCGEHFCTECLQVYDLRTNSAEARLFLCPECFRRRELKKANAWIMVGLIFVAFWFFVSLMNFIAGVLLILFISVPMVLYGIYKRGSIQMEKQSENAERKVLTKGTTVAELTRDADDTDTLYGKMLSQYAMKWGVANAKQLLDNEIYAYVRSGLDYEEAVRKVAQAKGIITAESEARAKTEAETEKEEKLKETRKSRMVR